MQSPTPTHLHRYAGRDHGEYLPRPRTKRASVTQITDVWGLW